jgi:hypothetical protein
MVLRGSKTKPDVSLTEAIEKKTEADRQVETAENDVKRSEMDMTLSHGNSLSADIPMVISPIAVTQPIVTFEAPPISVGPSLSRGSC